MRACVSACEPVCLCASCVYVRESVGKRERAQVSERERKDAQAFGTTTLPGFPNVFTDRR